MLQPEQIILRLIVAALLGGAIGWDRERLERTAGLRTHLLVSVGAALIIIVSAFGFADILGTPDVILDPSRIAAQVVSGIGFLGAGTILFSRKQVRGLTTAASLWVTAGVGLAAGSGLFFPAIFGTVLVVAILVGVKQIEKRAFKQLHDNARVTVFFKGRATLSEIEAIITAADLTIQKLALMRGDEETGDYVEFAFSKTPTQTAMLALAEKLQNIESVRGVKI
jgi:putative Mg2+ transporter-C (MgtC) family protein